MEIILIYILLLLNIISFLLGYLLHSLKNNNNTITNSSFIKNNSSKVNNTNNTHSKIEIDDKKIVVNIDTKGLEKKYNELGDKVVSENNISNSINKLKNLKG